MVTDTNKKPIPGKPKAGTFDEVDRFMLSEYNRLTSMLLYTKEIGHKRVQFWLTVVSSAGGILMVIYQINPSIESFFPLVFFVCSFIVLLGIVIYIKMIQRTVTSVEYLRAQGKIKRYFLEMDKNIEDYLFFPVGDDNPKLNYSLAFSLTGSSLRILVAIINSFILGCVVGLIPRLVYGDWSMAIYQVILGVLTFALSFTLHETFTAYRFRKSDKYNKNRIKFPIYS